MVGSDVIKNMAESKEMLRKISHVLPLFAVLEQMGGYNVRESCPISYCNVININLF